MGADQRGSNPTPVILQTWTGATASSPVDASNPLPTSTTPASGSVQNVSAANLATITTGQLTATTTSGATSFVPALPGRKNLVITNASTTQGVFVGATGVAANTGHYIPPGASLSMGNTDGAAALAYFVITDANTALCTYLGVS